MNRLIRSLILFTGTLGLGAIAYALVKKDEEGFLGDLVPSAPKAGTGSITRCAGITQSGKRCSRESEPGSTFCWQHGG